MVRTFKITDVQIQELAKKIVKLPYELHQTITPILHDLESLEEIKEEVEEVVEEVSSEEPKAEVEELSEDVESQVEETLF